MASNTPNIGLYKKDPILDQNDTFNITTMLNQNWDKIDEDSKQKDNKIGDLSTMTTTEKSNLAGAVSEVKDELNVHLADLVSQELGKGASLIGIHDADNKFIATNVEGALKELFTNVSNGKSLVGGAITGVDPNVVIPTDPTFQQLASAIGQVSTGKKWASGRTTSNASGIVTITGLAFQPKITLVKYSGAVDPASEGFSIYVDKLIFTGGTPASSLWAKVVNQVISVPGNTVNSNGFSSNIATYHNQMCDWIAIE